MKCGGYKVKTEDEEKERNVTGEYQVTEKKIDRTGRKCGIIGEKGRRRFVSYQRK
jgi:hypothetical protein